MFQGKWYDEVEVGARFGTSLTVTETHLVLGSGMFGDFNPLHVDEEFAKKSMFGTRILHGPFAGALIAAPVGMYFSGTALAYLEHACRFKAPVRPGDTITGEVRVLKVRADKPITELATRVIRDDQTVVLEGTAVCYTIPLPARGDRSTPAPA